MKTIEPLISKTARNESCVLEGKERTRRIPFYPKIYPTIMSSQYHCMHKTLQLGIKHWKVTQVTRKVTEEWTFMITKYATTRFMNSNKGVVNINLKADKISSHPNGMIRFLEMMRLTICELQWMGMQKSKITDKSMLQCDMLPNRVHKSTCYNL